MAWARQVDRFCHQYLQLEQALDFPDAQWLQLAEVQEAIYEKIFADGAVPYAPPPTYQLRVLKQLVTRIEESIEDWDTHEVSENIVSSLSVLLATSLPADVAFAQQKCYVTYHPSALSACCSSLGSRKAVEEPHVTVLENRSLLGAGGTTGLRTWEASVHLGQYLSQNCAVVKGKRILELGSGTGYLSILCANYLEAEHVIASDGSDDVLNNLTENFFLNNLQDSPRISAMEVQWGYPLVGTEEEHWNGGRPIDLVIGSDITYDIEAGTALVGTLLDVFGLYPRVEVYIAQTERNEKTCQAFLDTCQRNKLTVGDLQFDVQPRACQDGPFYDDRLPIRIWKLSKLHNGVIYDPFKIQ